MHRIQIRQLGFLPVGWSAIAQLLCLITDTAPKLLFIELGHGEEIGEVVEDLALGMAESFFYVITIQF